MFGQAPIHLWNKKKKQLTERKRRGVGGWGDGTGAVITRSAKHSWRRRSTSPGAICAKMLNRDKIGLQVLRAAATVQWVPLVHRARLRRSAVTHTREGRGRVPKNGKKRTGREGAGQNTPATHLRRQERCGLRRHTKEPAFFSRLHFPSSSVPNVPIPLVFSLTLPDAI